MTEPSEQDIDRIAAYEEFRRYLEKMIHDFDAAGLTGNSRQEVQRRPSGQESSSLSVEWPSSQSPPAGGLGQSPASERAVTDQKTSRDVVSSEFKAIQDELIADVTEALHAVAALAGSAGGVPRPRPKLEPSGSASESRVNDSIARLNKETMEELRAVTHRQEEAIHGIIGDLVRVQRESQMELIRIIDELELRAIALEDYLGSP